MPTPKPVPVAKTLPKPELDDFASQDPLTGVSAPDFKLFIEGVEVKFDNISISTVSGGYPTASISMPYLPGMEEIGRGYFPKVHVFYLDYFQDLYYSLQPDKDKPSAQDRIRRSYKVLFCGEIYAAGYSKAKSDSAAQTTIVYQCRHKNHVMDRIGIGFAKFASDLMGSDTGSFAPGGLHDFNPGLVALKMLQGINPDAINSESPGDDLLFTPVDGDGKEPPKAIIRDVNALHASALKAIDSGVPGFMYNPSAGVDYRPQLRGMPGAVARLWNCIANDGYAFAWQQDAIRKIYYPLVRNMKYLEGLTGHPLIEEEVERTRVQVKASSALDTQQKDTFEKVTPMNPRRAADKVDDKGVRTPLSTEIQAAIQDATFQAVTSLINTAPPSMPLSAFAGSVLNNLCYEMVTLASPVMRDTKTFSGDESAPGSAYAPIETVIKPVMPGYFSPRCNVLYPSMYNRIDVQDMYDTPTRLVSDWNHPASGQNGVPSMFHLRAPFSVREAVAIKFRGDTKNESISAGAIHPCNTPASHEMSRGIHAMTTQVPSWMNLYLNADPSDQPANSAVFENMFEYLDYQYGLQMMAARRGNVSGCFNPYIVPGYPMDIIDSSPSRPSYHAFCVAVIHNISSSGSIGTSVSFEGAMTFEQLYSTEYSQVLPWIADVLKIGKTTPLTDANGNVTSLYRYHSLVRAEKETRDTADSFYTGVLGVGAAIIDDLIEYKYSEVQEGVAIDPSMRNTKSKDWRSAMAVTRRSIQTMENLEKVHGMKFITTEMIPAQATMLREYPFRDGYPADLAYSKGTGLDPTQVPISRSMFLNYNYVVHKSWMLSSVVAKQGDGATAAATPGTTVNDPNVNSSYVSPVRTGAGSWNDGSFAKMQATGARAAHAAEILKQELELRKIPGFPINLFVQLIYHESSFNPNAVGTNKGSTDWGYGQINDKAHPEAFTGVSNVRTNPIANIRFAAGILKKNYKYFRDKDSGMTDRACWNNATVAYNLGQGGTGSLKGEGSGVYLYGKSRNAVEYFNAIFDTSTVKT